MLTAGLGFTGTVAGQDHGNGRGPPDEDSRGGGRGPSDEDENGDRNEAVGDTFGYYYPSGMDPEDAPVEELSDVGFHALDIDDDGMPVVTHEEAMATISDRANAAGTTPHLQIGGWGVDFSAAVANAPEFASEAADIMQAYNYRGIDIDWEYPDDGSEFARLMSALRDELDARGDYHLGAAVSVVPSIADGVYAVDEIAPIVDYLFLMCYDFAGPWSGSTGHNSALRSTDTQWKSVESGIAYWREQPISDEKLLGGIPFYGRSFTGVSDEKHGYDLSFESGDAHGYGGVKSMLADDSFETFWDDDADVPFAYSAEEETFLSYETPESLSLKADYIRSVVGGVGIWSINQDVDRELISAVN